jgi:hypothetical protein
MQSVSEAQVVAHAVPTHCVYGEQLTGAGVMQTPWPSQSERPTLCAGAPELPGVHVALAQTVPSWNSAQWPKPSQNPLSPHVAGPWLVQSLCGSVSTLAPEQTPSVPPVSALVHASQVLLHALLQHTPSAQKPLVHCEGPVQSEPPTFWFTQVPPLIVMSQNFPLAQSASFAHWTHVMAVQTPLAQSVAMRHALVRAHGGHEEPPQSTSVSVPSFMPSLHEGDTHWLPVQTSLPVQSAVLLHPTQVPLPSQTLPPSSEHEVPFEACDVPQALPVHVFVMHLVCWDGQSDGMTHATQLPLPSQTVPPWSEHIVSAPAFMVVHMPAEHAAVLQLVLVAGQSVAGLVHMTPVLVVVVVAPPMPPVLVVVVVAPPMPPVLLVVVAPPVLDVEVVDVTVPLSSYWPRTSVHEDTPAKRSAAARTLRVIRTSPARRPSRGRSTGPPPPPSPGAP